MPQFKNIRVPVGKTGKTRLQRVQVLKSGKFKFVKNLKKGSGSQKSKAKRSSSKKKGKVRNTAKGKLFRSISGAGALEDVGVGFIGFTLLGKTPAALPLTRTLQGIAAHAMGRRGKRHAIQGILDLVTLWLAGGIGVAPRFGGGTGFGGGGGGAILFQLQQLAKTSPL
jgi:hypothetical protein